MLFSSNHILLFFFMVQCTIADSSQFVQRYQKEIAAGAVMVALGVYILCKNHKSAPTPTSSNASNLKCLSPTQAQVRYEDLIVQPATSLGLVGLFAEHLAEYGVDTVTLMPKSQCSALEWYVVNQKTRVAAQIVFFPCSYEMWQESVCRYRLHMIQNNIPLFIPLPADWSNQEVARTYVCEMQRLDQTQCEAGKPFCSLEALQQLKDPHGYVQSNLIGPIERNRVRLTLNSPTYHEVEEAGREDFCTMTILASQVSLKDKYEHLIRTPWGIGHFYLLLEHLNSCEGFSVKLTKLIGKENDVHFKTVFQRLSSATRQAGWDIAEGSIFYSTELIHLGQGNNTHKTPFYRTLNAELVKQKLNLDAPPGNVIVLLEASRH